MDRKIIRKLSIELVVITLISVFVLSFFYLISSDDSKERVQQNYSELFANVLEASYYEEIEIDNLDDYSGLLGVYEGFNEDGSPLGFITDVLVVTDNNEELHLLTGITYDGAELTGLSRIHDERNPVAISDQQIAVIASQAVGSQIPLYVNHPNETFDLDSSSPRIPGLHDGIFYAQVKEPDNNGYIDYVEIEVTNGSITRVQWDAFNIERNIKDRIDAAISGAYVISGENWATQSYNLCHALINCQDPARLAMKSDGTTSIVDGVTIEISTFVQLAYECINNSIYDFNEEEYKAGLASIISGIFNSDPETLGIYDDEGNIVFSFEDYPNAFAIYDEENNITGYTNVLGKVRGIVIDTENMNISSPQTTGTPNDSSVVDGAEDGVNIGDVDTSSDNIDGIPVAEIRTYIDGIEGDFVRSRYVVTAVNVSYRFLKDYLNWMA